MPSRCLRLVSDRRGSARRHRRLPRDPSLTLRSGRGFQTTRSSSTCPGCLKGRVLAVSDTRETDTQSGPIVRGKSFRLAGKGDIMKQVKKEDGSFVEVTGIVKRSALDSKGITIGKRVKVGGGSPVAGTRSIPDPVADVAVMDISSVRHRSNSCAVK